MKTQEELKKLESKEFGKELSKARKEAMKLRFESKTGQLAGAHKLRLAKKDVARMLTARNSGKKSS